MELSEYLEIRYTIVDVEKEGGGSIETDKSAPNQRCARGYVGSRRMARSNSRFLIFRPMEQLFALNIRWALEHFTLSAVGIYRDGNNFRYLTHYLD